MEAKRKKEGVKWEERGEGEREARVGEKREREAERGRDKGREKGE